MIKEAIRQVVERTPPERDRHVDLLRAVAIALVVLGHWLVIAVTDVNDEIDGVNALRDLQWIHPFTWLFQVMPVFFFVGGYANLASWRSHREGGGDPTAWVIGRYERLVHPASALFGVLVLAVLVAQALGVDREQAATGAWLATVPLWFLLAYLAIITMTPVTAAAHDRWGLRVPLVLAVVAVGADLARFGAGIGVVGEVNYVVVWLCIHQLGYAWRDGRPSPGPATGWPLLLAGLATLVALTRWGPYPVSVVTAPGQGEQNTEPPTVAILALAIAQLGLAYLTRAPLNRWLRRQRPWTAVVAMNSVVLTIFLWHMAAALAAAVLLYGTETLPAVDVGTTTWWLVRVPWLLGCLVMLAVLVSAFAAIERAAAGKSRSGQTVPGTGLRVALWAGVVAVLAGMLGVAAAGPGSHGPLGLPTAAIVAYGAGVLLFTAAARRIA